MKHCLEMFITNCDKGLLQIATAHFITNCDKGLLQTATSFITNCDRYYKLRQPLLQTELRQVLQIAMLLQIATVQRVTLFLQSIEQFYRVVRQFE